MKKYVQMKGPVTVTYRYKSTWIKIITGVMYVEKYTCIPVKKHGTVYTFQKNYMIVLTYRYQQVVL